MAKKKKQTRKRTPKQEYQEPSAFWPLAGAILMFLLAVFVLLGMFGTGGPLPQNLYEGVYWAIGWGGIWVPIALVFFGILKFTSEDRQIPLAKFTSMLALITMAAAWLHVGFTSKLTDGSFTGGHGGEVGRLFGNLALNALDKMPAPIMVFVFTLLLFFLTFGISPRVILKLLSVFVREREDDTDLADLKSKAPDNAFKMNEGVPVEHHSGRDASRMNSFKNSAQKLTGAESHDALTTTTDPDWQYP